MTEEKQNVTTDDVQETSTEGNKVKKALEQQFGAFSGPMSFDEFITMLDKLDEEVKK